MYTFDFRYPQKKNCTDLNQVNEQAIQRHHPIRLNDQGTSPSKSPSHVKKCGLLPHPIETKHCPIAKHIQFWSEKSF